MKPYIIAVLYAGLALWYPLSGLLALYLLIREFNEYSRENREEDLERERELTSNIWDGRQQRSTYTLRAV